MSDLDAPQAPARLAAPITVQAIGKLQNIGRSRLVPAQADGLIDAFAEVFAAIAAAKPPQPEQPPSDSVLDLGVDQEPESTSVDDSGQQGRNTDEAEQVNPLIDAVLGDGQQQVNPVRNHDQPQPQQTADRPEAPQRTDAGLDETKASRQPEIVQIETENRPGNVDAPEPQTVIAPQAVEQRDRGQRRRDPRDSTPAEPIQNVPHRRVDRGQQISDPRPATNPADPQSDHPAPHASEESGVESSLWVRPRRGDGGRPQQRQVPEPGQTHSDQRFTTSLLSSGYRPAAEPALADPSGSANPPARTTTPDIANIQNVVQSTTAARSAVGPQTGTPGNRGAVSPLDHAARRTIVKEPYDARAGSSRKTPSESVVSRVKLVQRVSRAFQHLGPEGGVVRLRLAPAELGSVRIEMKVLQRKVQARVIAETEAASAALREHLPELRQRLELQRMQVERIEIDVESGEATDLGSHTGQQRHDRSDPDRWRPIPTALGNNTPRQSASVSHPQPVSRAASTPSHGGVDLRL